MAARTDNYEQLPENEDLTMHLAEAAKISVMSHSLIRLADFKKKCHFLFLFLLFWSEKCKKIRLNESALSSSSGIEN